MDRAVAIPIFQIAVSVLVALIGAGAAIRVASRNQTVGTAPTVQSMTYWREDAQQLRKDMADLRAENTELRQRVEDLEQRVTEKDGMIARQAIDNERLRALLAARGGTT